MSAQRLEPNAIIRPKVNAARILLIALIVGSALTLGGCMDMFDPAGGRYARGRFVDPAAYSLVETRPSDAEVTYVFEAKKPAGKAKLRSVYLFSYLPPERRDGPKLKFEFNASAQLVVSIKKDDVVKYSGVTIFGDYQSPEEAISGARSVNIAQEVFFTK